MISKFKIKGEWKIPDKDEWINGTLIFDPEFGNKLELFGTFNPFIFDRKSQKIILGKTTDGDFTLIDNWYRGKKQVNNGITIGTYKPIIILRGHHFNELSSIKFSHVKFSTFNLFQWLNLSGLETNISKPLTSYEIKYDSHTGLGTIEADVSGLNWGLYLLVLDNGDNIQSKNIIIQK